MYRCLRSRTERRAAFAPLLVLVAVGVVGVVGVVVRSAGLAQAEPTRQDTFASVSFIDARDGWALIERPCTGSPWCEVVEVTSDGGMSWHPVGSLPACDASAACREGNLTVGGITPVTSRVAIASARRRPSRSTAGTGGRFSLGR
jgi:hypothetical protein